jgi:hypothetical protein
MARAGLTQKTRTLTQRPCSADPGMFVQQMTRNSLTCLRRQPTGIHTVQE